jgi:hypothetical protein
MVEEITAALSRFKWLFVIARNSSFTYKGKAVNAKQVGRELGVRYVLEGSVRKAAGKVRIAGQLIDAVMTATFLATGSTLRFGWRGSPIPAASLLRLHKGGRYRSEADIADDLMSTRP